MGHRIFQAQAKVCAIPTTDIHIDNHPMPSFI